MDSGPRDYDLTITTRKQGEVYEAVCRSAGGDARELVAFRWSPGDQQALDGLLGRGLYAQGAAAEARGLLGVGQRLFETFIGGDLRTCFDASRIMAERDGRALRLRLVVDPPELIRLPWELLCDPRTETFLALSRHTPVLRYVAVPRPLAALKVKPPLNILGMVASPSDRPRLNVAAEQQRLEEALAPLKKQGRVELAWVEGETGSSLQRALRLKPWHIFHFIGHGGFDPMTQTAHLVLACEDGLADPIRSAELAPLLADQRSLRLAVLNACQGAASGAGAFSSLAAGLVRQGLPAVVAMQQAVVDEAAVEFGHSFYQALGEGLALETCLAEARKALLVCRGTLEWSIPALHTHTDGSRLFAFPKPKAARRARVEPPAETQPQQPQQQPKQPQPEGGANPADCLPAVAAVERGGGVRGVGFFVRPDGLLVTTHNAVDAAGEITVVTARGRRPADLVGGHEQDNLALLRVAGEGYPAVEVVGQPGGPAVGSAIHLVGWDGPVGVTLSRGEVSGATRLADYPRSQLITADVSLPPGYGGAPVFNEQGELLGMAVYFWSEGGRLRRAYILPAGSLGEFVQAASPVAAAPQAGRNPFFVGGAAPPELFVGRRSSLRLIQERLGGRSLQSVSIVGERRIGKSSLLRYVCERSEELFGANGPRPVYLDLMKAYCHTLPGFLKALQRGLTQALGREPWPAAAGDLGELSFALEDLSRSGARLVICLDEVEELTRRGAAFEGLLEELRAAGQMGQIGLLTASAHPLADLCQQGGLVSPFFNIFVQDTLGLLEAAEWQSLVGSRLAVSPAELAAIERLAGGHPFYTQLAAGNLWAARSGDGAADWEARTRSDLAPHWASLWAHLPAVDQGVLRQAAGLPGGAASPARAAELARRGWLRQGRPFSAAFEDWMRSR